MDDKKKLNLDDLNSISGGVTMQGEAYLEMMRNGTLTDKQVNETIKNLELAYKDTENRSDMKADDKNDALVEIMKQMCDYMYAESMYTSDLLDKPQR